MKIINGISNAITNILRIVCMVLAAAMALIIFLQIICRLFFTPLLWSEEASRIMMIWLIFLGSALLYDMPKNGHIQVDLLDQAIPPMFKKYLNAFVKFCMVVIIVVGVVGGYDLAITSMKVTSTALHIPFAYIYGAILTSFVVMLWYTLVQFLNWIVGKKNRANDSI